MMLKTNHMGSFSGGGTDLGIPATRCGLVGVVDTPDFALFDPHFHLECEMNVVVGGWADVLLPESRVRVSAGRMLMLPSRLPHSLVAVSDDVRLWVVVMRPEEVADFPRGAPQSAAFTAEEGRRFDRLAGEVSREDDDAIVNAGLRYLTSLLLRGGERRAALSGRKHPALFRVIECLNHETEPLTARQLARRAGVSTPHLLRLIRQETGSTLTSLRQTLRLRRFMEAHCLRPEAGLLPNALDAGFGSYNQFARVFNARYGVPPKRYFQKTGKAGRGA